MLFAIWIHGEQVFAAEENGTRDTCLRCGVSQEAYLVTRCPRQIRHGRLCFSIPGYIRYIVYYCELFTKKCSCVSIPRFQFIFHSLGSKKNSLSSLSYTTNTIQSTWKSIFFLFYINKKYTKDYRRMDQIFSYII